jgi:hypothetical protein
MSSQEFIFEASRFLSEISDAELQEVERTLQDFVDVTRSDYILTKGANVPSIIAAWLVIRMTHPTNQYTHTEMA